MNIADVMEELGRALETIEGLRVSAYPGGDAVPPAGKVNFPESIDFDRTMARGIDELTLEVSIVVSDAVSRVAPALMAPYVAGDGSSSVKSALETYSAYTALHTVTVESCRFDTELMGDVQYLVAIFTVKVTGPGKE